MAERFQVIIVGGGPVGVGLAVELGLRGVSCALIERHLEPQRIPKGQNLTQRTLEHFYAWGVEDELRAARLLPPGYPIGGVTAYSNLMSDYWFAPAGREVVRQYFYTANERLPQYLTEAVLRTRLEGLPSVKTYFGRTAQDVEQDQAGVRVILAADGASRPEEALEGDYVVGCDGARSTVREQIGIDRQGADFDQRMVLAVFRSRELHEGLKRFPERTTYRVLRPALKGYWQFFGRVDVGEGWFFHAPVPTDTTPDTYDVHKLLQDAAGFSFPVTFDHVGFWDLRIAVAAEYRRGRAFIAGDACHSHPPYGGYGLNTGLEDARNLGWKLSATLQGWGGDALLASYGEERRPIFVETGEAMIAGGIERDREFLERYSPERDRAEFEAAWRTLPGDTGVAQSYEPHYEGSSVVMGPPGGKISIQGRHSYVARAGHHLTPQPLSSGRNVFEELGAGYTLLAFGADEAAAQAFKAAATSLGVPLSVVRDGFDGGREAYESRMILVRPDEHVVWTGNKAPDDARALLSRVTGMTGHPAQA